MGKGSAEIRMQRFIGSANKRFSYLGAELMCDCHGAGLEQAAVVPFENAVYAVAATVAAGSRKGLRALRVIAIRVRLLQKDPRQPMSLKNLVPSHAAAPLIRKVVTPPPSDAGSRAVPRP